MADKTELIPLGGSAQRTDEAGGTNVELIRNFVPVITSPTIGGQKQLRVMKRRGYETLLVAPAATYTFSEAMQWTGVLGTGALTARGVLVYTAYKQSTDLKLYKWNTSETTLGTFSTAGYKCIGIQETLISGVANLTLNIGNLASPFDQKLLIFPNGGALAEVVDADFPVTTIGRGVHMDGYYFVASTDGYIYVSDINSLTLWTSGNRIAVQMEPDTLVGLGRIRNVIVAFGTKSIEFYQNSGASGQPLARISQAGLNIGCVSGSSIQRVGEDIAFISIGYDGVGVHLLSGFQVKKISTKYVDELVALGVDSASEAPLPMGIYQLTCTSGVVKERGVTGITFNFPSSGGASGHLIYYPELDLWTEFKSAAVPTTNATFVACGQANIVTGVSGFIYHDNDLNIAGGLRTSGQDYDATAFEAFIQTAPLSHGTARRKFYKSARLIGEQPVVSTPVVLSGSDDEGTNFTTYGTFDMSVNPIVPITRMGSSRRRIWKLSNTSAASCVIDALELTYEEASN